ncbi:unnamed protein product [Rhizophagus irregularis]|nr:unnamed protein product [Rhizophagus irregularis]
MGGLFLIDKLYSTKAMTVLMDCNDYWNIYYFMTIEDKKQYIVKCNISNRDIALAIIKEFVLQEESFFNELDRMSDMVDDMSEQELFNMTVCKRLILIRDFCRLDEQPQVNQLIGKFSDNYENLLQ